VIGINRDWTGFFVIDIKYGITLEAIKIFPSDSFVVKADTLLQCLEPVKTCPLPKKSSIGTMEG
jgi:hypothetical protein